MDCSLPGSSLHGILQERTLEWVAISFSNHSTIRLLQKAGWEAVNTWTRTLIVNLEKMELDMNDTVAVESVVTSIQQDDWIMEKMGQSKPNVQAWIVILLTVMGGVTGRIKEKTWWIFFVKFTSSQSRVNYLRIVGYSYEKWPQETYVQTKSCLRALLFFFISIIFSKYIFMSSFSFLDSLKNNSRLISSFFLVVTQVEKEPLSNILIWNV